MFTKIKPCSNKTFTLAEVLITLGIIGVVASLTLPSLISKHKDKELITRVKKTYSDISNAVSLSRMEGGSLNDNSIFFNPNNTHFETAQQFVKYFNGAKLCENMSQDNCSQFYYGIKYSKFYTDGGDAGVEWLVTYMPAIILTNGAILYVNQSHIPDCYGEETYEKHDENGRPILDADGKPVTATSLNTVCAYIYFDVNGPKLPNRFGQDAYYVQIEKNFLRPGVQPYLGRTSLENILSGNENFSYEDYKIGSEE